MRRLRRLERLFVETPQYFLTACTHDRIRILADEEVHQVFREFCLRGKERGAFVGPYVLMPDHLHLFVAIPAGDMNLSQWVKALKNTLSKHWRASGVSSPHWQKGFFDHVLRSEESSAQKWKYVRENPVRAGLVQQAEEWPFAGEILPPEFGCPLWRRSATAGPL